VIPRQIDEHLLDVIVDALKHPGDSDRFGAQLGVGGRPPQHQQVSQGPEGEAMLTDFYGTFATVCFTLLGLWIVVVQTRHAEWRRSAVHRRRAYAVAFTSRCPG
jgi:hypothetical protein